MSSKKTRSPNTAPTGARGLKTSTVRMIKPKFPQVPKAGEALKDVSAPVAVSTMQHRYARMSGDMTDGVTLRCCEPFTSLVYDGSGADVGAAGQKNAFIMPASDNGTSYSQRAMYTLALNPLASAYYSPLNSGNWAVGTAFSDGVWANRVALSFSRYRVKSFTLHYRPQIGTDTSIRFWLVFTDDPAHPAYGVNEFSNSIYPNDSVLLSNSNCLSFAAWTPWSASFPVDGYERYVSINGEYAASTSSLVYDSASIRHTCFGALAGLSFYGGTGTAPGAPVITGELYWEVEWEFFDPAPLFSFQFIPQFLEESKKFRKEKTIEYLREEEDGRERERPRSVCEDDGDFLTLKSPNIVRRTGPAAPPAPKKG